MSNLKSIYLADIDIELKKYPVKVYHIARALGIEVLQSDCIPDNITGTIQPNEDNPSQFTIVVNASHPLRRRRLTIAHLIAHYLLHKDVIGEGVTEDTLYRSNLPFNKEVEANNMALDILMPWEQLNAFLTDNHIVVNELADMFDVAPSVMMTRLGIPVECRTP